jgi:hypothetical protein
VRVIDLILRRAVVAQNGLDTSVAPDPCGGEVAERRAVPGCSAASLSDRFLIPTPEM